MAQHIHLRIVETDDLLFLHSLFNNPNILDFWFSESYMSLENFKKTL